MKRFALPLSLAVLVFALACTDSTSPDRHAMLTRTNPTLSGNVPPPPTRSAVVISVASPDVLVGKFTGVYFANGGSSLAVQAASELADPTLAWNGTSWLRLDNTQTLGSLASANARFQVTRGLTTAPNFSGRGTLGFNCSGSPTICADTVTIDRVTSFVPIPDCLVGALCATIVFDASINGQPGHQGTAQAFDREVCQTVFIPESEESFLFCPFFAGS